MSSERGVFIGVDLGGTNVRAGAVSPQGDLENWQSAPIEAKRGPEVGVNRISNLIEQVAKSTSRTILGIGIGSTGPLDRLRGCIQNPYTLPGWEDVDIVSPMEKRFGVPVALENDADAAALGESWVGAGKGYERLFMVTIGTGVGTALVLNGEIYRGVSGAHPEGGHIVIDPAGPKCYCGAKGCWESLVSGPAIASLARQAPGLESSMLYQYCQADAENLDASMVFEAARQADPLSLRLLDQVAEYIALGLVNVLRCTCRMSSFSLAVCRVPTIC
jgi:glucokinase